MSSCEGRQGHHRNQQRGARHVLGSQSRGGRRGGREEKDATSCRKGITLSGEEEVTGDAATLQRSAHAASASPAWSESMAVASTRPAPRFGVAAVRGTAVRLRRVRTSSRWPHRSEMFTEEGKPHIHAGLEINAVPKLPAASSGTLGVNG